MIDFSEIYIAGMNASYEECIIKASMGEKVVILYDAGETESGRNCIDLVNFDEHEAKEFYKMVDNMIGGGVRMKKIFEF